MYKIADDMLYATQYVHYVARCMYETQSPPVGYVEYVKTIWPIEPYDDEGAIIGFRTFPAGTDISTATTGMVAALTGVTVYEAEKMQRYNGVAPSTANQSRIVEYEGRSMTLQQWATELGVTVETMVRRYLTYPNNLDKVMRARYSRG